MEGDFKSPWPKLPLECCWMILDYLGQDPSSLAALLQTSRATFALVAPRLYQDPFKLLDMRQPPNRTRKDHRERTMRLFVTLLHGLLEPVGLKGKPFLTTTPQSTPCVDPLSSPNRYLKFYTHVDLTHMPGSKKGTFRQLFSPKNDNVGLPMIGVKNLLQYQSSRITSLRIPLRLLNSFRPYQQTPSFPDFNLFAALSSLKRLEVTNDPPCNDDHLLQLLWHGVRDGIALRREDLGEHTRLDSILLLYNYNVATKGPGDVASGAHPGLHSFTVQAITDISYLLSSFSDSVAHSLRRISFIMDTTPLVKLLPLLKRFDLLEDLSIFLTEIHPARNLQSLVSEPSTSTLATSESTLSIKRLRVYIDGTHSSKHIWLQDAIELSAKTLEELTVIESRNSRIIESYGFMMALNPLAAAVPWLGCRLPELTSLTFISNDIAYPFTPHSFSIPPDNTRPTVGNGSEINSATGARISGHRIFPRLTSLSLICTELCKPANFLSGAYMEPILHVIGQLPTLQHLLLDFSFYVDYKKLNINDIFERLPQGLHTIEFGAFDSSPGPSAVNFDEKIRQALMQRYQENTQDAMNGAVLSAGTIRRQPIPKLTTVTSPRNFSFDSLEAIFWQHQNVRDFFYQSRKNTRAPF